MPMYLRVASSSQFAPASASGGQGLQVSTTTLSEFLSFCRCRESNLELARQALRHPAVSLALNQFLSFSSFFCEVAVQVFYTFEIKFFF